MVGTGNRRGGKEQIYHLSAAVTFLIWIAASCGSCTFGQPLWEIYQVVLCLGSNSTELSHKYINNVLFLTILT